jgi:hypothetical protein
MTFSSQIQSSLNLLYLGLLLYLESMPEQNLLSCFLPNATLLTVYTQQVLKTEHNYNPSVGNVNGFVYLCHMFLGLEPRGHRMNYHCVICNTSLNSYSDIMFSKQYLSGSTKNNSIHCET